jgi:diacylglycerol O-acyltransferase / wax synthase
MLDRTRPLWRMWFVTGLPDARVALVVALDHAVADGLAAVQLVGTLLAVPPGLLPDLEHHPHGPLNGPRPGTSALA